MKSVLQKSTSMINPNSPGPDSPVTAVEKWYQARLTGDTEAANAAIQDAVSLGEQPQDGSIYASEQRLFTSAFARLAAADGSEADQLGEQPGEVKVGSWGKHESLRKTENGFVMEAMNHSGLGGYRGPLSSGSWVIKYEMNCESGTIAATSTRMTGLTGRGRSYLTRQKYTINPSTQKVGNIRNGLMTFLPEF